MITKDNVLNNDLRKQIYLYIKETPGLHLREISRKMNIPLTSCKHHLKLLCRLNLISKSLENSYDRYFIFKSYNLTERKIISVLRQDTPRGILVYLLTSIACSPLELCKELNKTPSTINYHLKNMLYLGILEIAEIKEDTILLRKGGKINRDICGREKIYKIKDKETSDIIYNLLLSNIETFKDKEYIYNIFALMEEVKTNKSPLFKKYSSKNVSSRVLNRIYDIFPHPYHV